MRIGITAINVSLNDFGMLYISGLKIPMGHLLQMLKCMIIYSVFIETQ